MRSDKPERISLESAGEHRGMIPSDDVLEEHRYLIERGVRALALVGCCEPSDVATVLHRLAVIADGRSVPFVVANGAMCGFAANAWAIDLLAWASESAPRVQLDRILGLLLGYESAAIARFGELGSTLRACGSA